MPHFGLPYQTLATVRHILSDFPAVEKAILYGSRAEDRYRHGSDIDLTLVGEELDLSALEKIAARLEESSIPYQVDLSLWDATEDVELRERIERTGKLFYERHDPGAGL